MALLKHLPVGPDARLQFRLEVFNLFNRVNYDLPDGFLGSPTFGRILSGGRSAPAAAGSQAAVLNAEP